MNYREVGLISRDPTISEFTLPLRQELFTRILAGRPAQRRKTWKRLLAVVTLGLISLAAKPMHHQNQTRELIVNQTLDAVLEVGSNYRMHGQHPTWQQIEREAARKMNVVRNEWWR
jgi:hypothetical protein